MKEMEKRAKEERKELEGRVEERMKEMEKKMTERVVEVEGRVGEDGEVGITIPNYSALQAQDKEW